MKSPDAASACLQLGDHALHSWPSTGSQLMASHLPDAVILMANLFCCALLVS